MEREILKYTNIGLQLCHLLDTGETLDINVTLQKLHEKSIVEYLKHAFAGS